MAEARIIGEVIKYSHACGQTKPAMNLWRKGQVKGFQCCRLTGVAYKCLFWVGDSATNRQSLQ